MTTTIGDLTPNAIGRNRILVRHEGSTISGLLTDLGIETELVRDSTYCGKDRVILIKVRVTVALGSITIGPLERSHQCEVLS